MTKSLTGGVALALTVLLLPGRVSVVRADGKKVTGRVTAFDRETLTVKNGAGQMVTFSLENDTRYDKWVTQKPWQQSTVADWSFLKVGKRVIVEQTLGDGTVKARVVHIATD